MKTKIDELEPIWIGDLMRWVFRDFIDQKPENENCFTEQFYCHNEDCVVREFEVKMKLYGEPKPIISCPACGSRKISSHGYVRSEGMTPEKWIIKMKEEQLTQPPPESD